MKLGTDRLLTFPKLRACEYRAVQPRSIAEVSEADNLTMILIGSERAIFGGEMEQALRASPVGQAD